MSNYIAISSLEIEMQLFSLQVTFNSYRDEGIICALVAEIYKWILQVSFYWSSVFHSNYRKFIKHVCTI